jgi:hypothetical protein
VQVENPLSELRLSDVTALRFEFHLDWLSRPRQSGGRSVFFNTTGCTGELKERACTDQSTAGPATPPPPPVPPPATAQCTVCKTYSDFSHCAAVVSKECCNEPNEKCVHGQPQSCNAGCAAVLRPMVSACTKGYLATHSWMSSTQQQLEAALKTCGPGRLSCNTPSDLFTAVGKACCKDGTTCSNGLPKTCTAKCASVLKAMTKACSRLLNSPGMGALQAEVAAAAKRCTGNGH